jgi:hypothetical protein
MISPLSPSYLLQNPLATNPVGNPQGQGNQQDQLRQTQNQVPQTPPVEEVRPRPENFGSTEQFGEHQEASLENRSETIQLHQDPARIKDASVKLPANTSKTPVELGNTTESASRSQTEMLIREGNTQTNVEKANVSNEDHPSPSDKPQQKIKSPYITQDPVIAGRIVDSVA